MLSVVLVQDDQIPLGETQECGIYSCYQIKLHRHEVYGSALYRRFILQEMTEESESITRIWTVQQSHHILGLLPQALEEGDHQIADVLCIVGGERVLVSFDGGQRETLALEFTSSAK